MKEDNNEILDSSSFYRRYLSSITPYTAKDNDDALRRYNEAKTTDEKLEIRDEIFSGNFPLVYDCVCKKIRQLSSNSSNTSSMFDDFIQEGNNALLKAIERFDPSNGANFSTYAYTCIDGSLNDYMNKYLRPIRIPTNILKKARLITKTRDSLEKKYDRKPTSLEIQKELGDDVSIKEIETLPFMISSSTPFSLDKGLEDEDSLFNYVKSDEPTPKEEAEMNEKREKLLIALSKLSPNEKYVFLKRHPLGEDNPLTLQEIALELSLSIERVRQIEKRAIEKLKEAIN